MLGKPYGRQQTTIDIGDMKVTKLYKNSLIMLINNVILTQTITFINLSLPISDFLYGQCNSVMKDLVDMQYDLAMKMEENGELKVWTSPLTGR